MSNTYIVFVCIFARSQSFYDFYGNTTQVRNIYGITISSFIVDINFTHWIATVCVRCVFGLTVLSAAHLLRRYVRAVCIVIFMSCLAYVRQNTQPSNQLKYTVSLNVSNVTLFYSNSHGFDDFFSLEILHSFSYLEFLLGQNDASNKFYLNDASRMCLRAVSFEPRIQISTIK